MNAWIGVALVALVALGAGALLLRTSRNLWTLLAAIVVFGLAGYAWQGSPGYPSAPARAAGDEAKGNVGLVDARREFFSVSNVPSNFVTVADGFARTGDFGRAARLLQGVVAKNPDDGEAWLALGIALVEHAGGRVTKPAEFAMAQAHAKLPGNPGPAFFDGVNMLRTGDLPEVHKIWSEGLEQATPEAEGRQFLSERLLGLERLMQSIVAQQQQQQQQQQGEGPAPGPAPR